MSIESEKWLTPEMVEAEYGFSQSTQAKMRMASYECEIPLPFFKIGTKYIRYLRTDIDEWLEKHRMV